MVGSIVQKHFDAFIYRKGSFQSILHAVDELHDQYLT